MPSDGGAVGAPFFSLGEQLNGELLTKQFVKYQKGERNE